MEQKFTVFVDRAPIPDEENSLVLVVVIVVIVLLVLVITGKMMIVMTGKYLEVADVSQVFPNNY